MNETAPEPLPARRRSFKRKLFVGTAIAGVAALQVTLLVKAFDLGIHEVRAAAPEAPAVSLNLNPTSFAPLVKAVAPAVVNISTTQKMDQQGMNEENGFSGFPPGSPFDEFLKHFFNQQQMQGPHNEKVHALGSGFIIDPSGYVVTNNHVIGNAEEITVIVNQDQKYPAKLIGRDAKTDLALLKIDAGKPLPYVSFGNSDAAEVGDWVVAVGNPFGLGGTVTAGILSARGRDLNSGPFDDFLQVDAPINRGNSGGPLFNAQGKVIGINSAIISPNGGSVGVGFAIPASLAEPVVEQLRVGGKVDRGWLGVTIQPVTPEIAEGLDLSKPAGALVSNVNPGSPAAKAGLQQGDVILKFAGKPVAQLHDLPRLVANTKAGQTAELGIWRNGKEIQLSATIAPLKDNANMTADAGHGGKVSPANALGLALAPLDPATRQRFGIDQEIHGVLVVGVQDGSPAADRGLRPGDVIVKVGSQKVNRPDQVAQHIDHAREAGKKSVLMLVEREGNDRFVALGLATS